MKSFNYVTEAMMPWKVHAPQSQCYFMISCCGGCEFEGESVYMMWLQPSMQVQSRRLLMTKLQSQPSLMKPLNAPCAWTSALAPSQ